MKSVTQTAKLLKLSEERIRKLLQDGRILGAEKVGATWVIPDKPIIDPPLKKQFRRKK